MAQQLPAGTTVIVEQKSGTGCVTGCLALIGLMVVLAFVLPMCGLASLGAIFSGSDPGQTPPAPAAPSDATGSGVLVTEVTTGGSADLAGVLVGDLIVSYDSMPVSSQDELQAARDKNATPLAIGGAGMQRPMIVKRDGRLIRLSIHQGPIGVMTREP